jgi:Spy/CpxP family protein refolding chaperone
MSKLSLIAALALGGLMACSTLVTAQDAPPADAKKGGRKQFTPEQQLDRMTTQLTLTDEQKPKVKTVLEDTSKKMREIRSDTSLDQQARREKMQPIMEEQNKKMKGILTDDQYKKYQEMNQRRGKKGQGADKKADTKSQ